MSHDFGAGGVTGGGLGLLVRVAHSHFDDVALWEVKSRSKYYFFGGRRVAQRRDGMIYWVHGDHLGSTSVMTDEQGGQYGQAVRYYPYGQVRSGDPGTLPMV